MTVLTAGAPARVAAARRRARIAVIVIFAAHGTLIGSWAARIPAVKSDLGLSAGSLGLALLAPALGTIVVARAAGASGARYGSARVARIFAVIYCMTAWLPGVAPGLATLWLGLLLWGIAMGALDVAMNAQAVTVQGHYGRPLLSGFHATWSIGSFTGALLGGLGAALHVHVALQQAVLGVLLAVAVYTAGRELLPDPERAPGARRPARRVRLPRIPERRLVLLGVSAVFAFMAEGAVTDWSGVLLRDHLHVSAGQVSFGYAAFCVTMTIGRLSGDRVVHALGRGRCVAALTCVGALGMTAGLISNVLAGVVAGFAFLGIGLSILIPVLIGTAADTDTAAAPAIAAVSALGCVGLVAGPSLIGGVAELTSVQAALYLLPPFTLLAGVLGIAGIRLTRRTPSRL